MSIGRKMAALSIFSKINQKSFSLTDTFRLQKYQLLAFINVSTTLKRQQGSVQIQNLESFDSKMAIFSVIRKKFVVFGSERDISCYIFQNIRHTKLILIHEKVPGIITNR